MKVQIKCDKCRSKAMKIAAEAYGVSSVAIEGEDKDQVVVIGDGVDSVCLILLLRKKVGYASLISVAEVKENKEQKDETTVKKKVAKGPTPCPSSYYPHPQIYEMACYDSSPRLNLFNSISIVEEEFYRLFVAVDKALKLRGQIVSFRSFPSRKLVRETNASQYSQHCLNQRCRMGME
ncbi:hypothetical protein HHK36_006818 [Tetracentron sinense]|uniref:HMA domain-containing protein n=1 Tax=Tetracentron sinense TaxID=13715 RepID=A0A835DL51_TETSI|nr:hypothetical protein HHK36_006818 [Tetracentron sinense]